MFVNCKARRRSWQESRERERVFATRIFFAPRAAQRAQMMLRAFLVFACAGLLAAHVAPDVDPETHQGTDPLSSPSPSPTPSPTPTPVPANAPPINVTLSALSAYLQAKSKRHSYGYVYIRGAPRPLEFLRCVEFPGFPVLSALLVAALNPSPFCALSHPPHPFVIAGRPSEA
jgi:hypothetical protein